MGLYSRFILPHVINCACGARPIGRQRAKVAPYVRGEVLELGFGSGHNVPFLDPEQVTRVHAVEPEAGMAPLARKAAGRAPFPVEVHQCIAEDLDLPPQSIDTVFVTYTLCTIPDPAPALAATRRFLRPGGRLVFCEHGLAPDPDVQASQRKIEPFWRRIAGGCHLQRDIPRIIRDAGFAIDTVETMYLPNTPRWAGFNYWGNGHAA